MLEAYCRALFPSVDRVANPDLMLAKTADIFTRSESTAADIATASV
jgi:hypothetical protein